MSQIVKKYPVMLKNPYHNSYIQIQKWMISNT